MIVVDTSALIAILYAEPDAKRLADVLGSSSQSVIGAPTLFELRQVMGGRQQREGIADADDLLAGAGTTIVAWTPEMADIAAEAFLRYGKGQGHAAQLNFGDCMAYALAKALDAPLLFKGDDFSKTDIVSALA